MVVVFLLLFPFFSKFTRNWSKILFLSRRGNYRVPDSSWLEPRRTLRRTILVHAAVPRLEIRISVSFGGFPLFWLLVSANFLPFSIPRGTRVLRSLPSFSFICSFSFFLCFSRSSPQRIDCRLEDSVGSQLRVGLTSVFQLLFKYFVLYFI